jgi:hypothetical protein
MLTGYNTDFKFQGKIYHCQTEDGGLNSPSITSLLYFQGAILASRKTSYADILKADCLEEVVRDLMMEQHKQMIRDLMQGRLDLNNAPRESTYTPSPTPTPKAAPAPKAAAPVEKKPAAEASRPAPAPVEEAEKEKGLDDIILDFLAQEQKHRSQKK